MPEVHGTVDLYEAAVRFDERVIDFERAALVTSAAALATTLIVAVAWGAWQPREFGVAALVGVALCALAFPIERRVRRAGLGYVRDRFDESSGMTFSEGVARLAHFNPRPLVSIVAFPAGALLATLAGNLLSGSPVTANLVAAGVAGLTGGLVNAVLASFNTEGLTGDLVGVLSSVRARVEAIPPSARGGIARRFSMAFAAAIGVVAVAFAGGAVRIASQMQNGSIKPAEALTTGAILGACAVGAGAIVAYLAIRSLSRTIASPITRTVDLIGRLRAGEAVRDYELYGQPRLSHESGLLVEAFSEVAAARSNTVVPGATYPVSENGHAREPAMREEPYAVSSDAVRGAVGDIHETAEMLERSASDLALRAETFALDARENAGALAGSAETIQALDTAVARVTHGARDLALLAARTRETAARLRDSVQSSAGMLHALVQGAGAALQASTDLLELSATARSDADEAAAAVRQADRATAVVAGAMNELMAVAEKLQRDAANVAPITGKVDDFYERASLLALNASIEAARAGEKGRGFAVIAAELRQLADASASVTEEVASLVRSAAIEGDRAGEAGRRGTAAAEQSRETLGAASAALSGIASGLTAARARIAALAAAGSDQESLAASLAEASVAAEQLIEEGYLAAARLAAGAQDVEQSSKSGAETARAGAVDAGAIEQRGERIALAAGDLKTIAEAMREDAERIRQTVAAVEAETMLETGRPPVRSRLNP